MEIVRAQAGDAEAVARCQLDCWRESYQQVVAPERLAALDLGTTTAKWARLVAEPGMRVSLARADGGVAGFAAARLAGASADLVALYVRGALHGSGLADRLLGEVVGDAPGALWVLEAYARAQAFYRRHGYTLTGDRLLHEETGLTAVRMAR